MSILDLFRAPPHERIEDAVKHAAHCNADSAYHKHMRDYYFNVKCDVTPHDSVENAYEFARLFEKQMHHTEEATRADRRCNEAQAKLEALRKATQPRSGGDRL